MSLNLQSTSPPLHTWIFITAAFVLGIAALLTSIKTNNLYYLESNYFSKSANYERNIFSDYECLGWTRVFIAVLIFAVTLRSILIESWIHKTTYLSNTKLKAQPITFKGIRTQSYFTAWCWNILGLSFFINGILPLLENRPKNDIYLSWRSYLHIFAQMCFEIAAPMSMLVSSVIKFGIWPRLWKAGGARKTEQLKTFTNLMEHNVNVILVFIEVGLLGNLSLDIRHVFVVPIFAMLYVLFSYGMAPYWTPEKGPQYIYFFLDTTLGRTTSKALVVLYIVLILFYLIFSMLTELMRSTDLLWIRLGFVFTLSYFFCKFSD